jgi:hypothetical protein
VASRVSPSEKFDGESQFLAIYGIEFRLRLDGFQWNVVRDGIRLFA